MMSLQGIADDSSRPYAAAAGAIGIGAVGALPLIYGIVSSMMSQTRPGSCPSSRQCRVSRNNTSLFAYDSLLGREPVLRTSHRRRHRKYNLSRLYEIPLMN